MHMHGVTLVYTSSMHQAFSYAPHKFYVCDEPFSQLMKANTVYCKELFIHHNQLTIFATDNNFRTSIGR